VDKWKQVTSDPWVLKIVEEGNNEKGAVKTLAFLTWWY
jgi:hypothetical protein